MLCNSSLRSVLLVALAVMLLPAPASAENEQKVIFDAIRLTGALGSKSTEHKSDHVLRTRASEAWARAEIPFLDERTMRFGASLAIKARQPPSRNDWKIIENAFVLDGSVSLAERTNFEVRVFKPLRRQSTLEKRFIINRELRGKGCAPKAQLQLKDHHRSYVMNLKCLLDPSVGFTAEFARVENTGAKAAHHRGALAIQANIAPGVAARVGGRVSHTRDTDWSVFSELKFTWN